MMRTAFATTRRVLATSSAAGAPACTGVRSLASSAAPPTPPPSTSPQSSSSSASSGSSSSSTVASQFYRILDENTAPRSATDVVLGEVIDQSIDLKVLSQRSSTTKPYFRLTDPSDLHTRLLQRVRPGDVIDVPYEVTVSHSLRDFWQVRLVVTCPE
jgi:hypothetical protein